MAVEKKEDEEGRPSDDEKIEEAQINSYFEEYALADMQHKK